MDLPVDIIGFSLPLHCPPPSVFADKKEESKTLALPCAHSERGEKEYRTGNALPSAFHCSAARLLQLQRTVFTLPARSVHPYIVVGG